MTRFRERWKETLKALDIIGKGGASGEGNAHGTSPTAAGIITAANIAYTATGEDLFATYPGTIGGPDVKPSALDFK